MHNQDVARRPPRTQPSPALLELMSEERTDDEPALNPPPPAEQLQPLIRPSIPEPDWRSEERERAERDAPVELEPLESLQSRPAVKQTKRKRTPLLDEVKRWRDQNP
jgi:hypothetical protein